MLTFLCQDWSLRPQNGEIHKSLYYNFKCTIQHRSFFNISSTPGYIHGEVSSTPVLYLTGDDIRANHAIITSLSSDGHEPSEWQSRAFWVTVTILLSDCHEPSEWLSLACQVTVMTHEPAEWRFHEIAVMIHVCAKSRRIQADTPIYTVRQKKTAPTLLIMLYRGLVFTSSSCIYWNNNQPCISIYNISRNFRRHSPPSTGNHRCGWLWWAEGTSSNTWSAWVERSRPEWNFPRSPSWPSRAERPSNTCCSAGSFSADDSAAWRPLSEPTWWPWRRQIRTRWARSRPHSAL